ncbi:hypothetical protein PFICI_13065 [Pestalotiopsis fici W106-1]|uniref:non-specific serine/threonine protein kinase n=1 Tax=Pestalotiopsis fici (strain W106-1 / CGMCC3.15140) TaxID=1229662 RepID=W3WP38_PESFW|nr:uncharacterized protein PFICI_13065 [Pestalotiopsis fici W106-1]ETS74581.1 hypothetical protein PFICI_13065 [Pestalotiopsis fici W106-1]
MANVDQGADAIGGESEKQSLLDIFVSANGGPTLKHVLGADEVDSPSTPRYQTLEDEIGAEFLENIEDYRPGGFYPVDVGDEILGQFKVYHKLGHGRLATVWLAVNFITPEWKAIKIFKASCSAKAALCYEQAKVAIETQPQLFESKSFLLPDDGVWVDSPNGRHLCLVLPLLGPKITHHEDESADRQEKYLQQVVMCLRALHSLGIHHGGVHPGNLLQTIDVGDVPIDDMLLVLGTPITFPVKPADESDGEFAKSHAPKYLTAPTRGLKRLPLKPRIVLTDVEVALTMNEPARDSNTPSDKDFVLGWEKIKCDMWGLAFTVLRMRRALFLELPWYPKSKSWDPDSTRPALEAALGSLFSLVQSVLNTKDLNDEYLLGLRHLSVQHDGELDLTIQQNYVIKRALELRWKRKELQLLGNLLEETTNFRIRDWTLPEAPMKEAIGEEYAHGDGSPWNMANQYETLTGGLEPLLDNMSSSESDRSKSVVEGEEHLSRESASAEPVPEETGSKAQEMKETNKIPFITPVYSDEFDDFFTENPSDIVQSPGSMDDDPAEQSSEAPSTPPRSVTPPPKRPASPPIPPPPPSPSPEPELEDDPELDPEYEPEFEFEPEADTQDKAPSVRHRTINVILLGFTVAMALWTVLFTVFLLQAKTTATPGRSATAARKPGQPGILYLQTRRLSAHTSFFEGIMASPEQSVPLDDRDGRAVFEGLDFFESEFGSLAG